jgi:hypothetical protein
MEFLDMKDSCTNTPRLRASLDEAMQELGWTVPVLWLDVNELSRAGDLRVGYGSPTILVDGHDLFAASQPATCDPSCRLYSGGLPTVADIVRNLKKVE